MFNTRIFWTSITIVLAMEGGFQVAWILDSLLFGEREV